MQVRKNKSRRSKSKTKSDRKPLTCKLSKVKEVDLILITIITFPVDLCLEVTNGISLTVKPSANFRYTHSQCRWKVFSSLACWIRTATKFTHQQWCLFRLAATVCAAFWKITDMYSTHTHHCEGVNQCSKLLLSTPLCWRISWCFFVDYESFHIQTVINECKHENISFTLRSIVNFKYWIVSSPVLNLTVTQCAQIKSLWNCAYSFKTTCSSD